MKVSRMLRQMLPMVEAIERAFALPRGASLAGVQLGKKWIEWLPGGGKPGT